MYVIVKREFLHFFRIRSFHFMVFLHVNPHPPRPSTFVRDKVQVPAQEVPRWRTRGKLGAGSAGERGTGAKSQKTRRVSEFH